MNITIDEEKQKIELHKLERIKIEVRRRINLKIYQRKNRRDDIPAGFYTWLCGKGTFKEEIRIYCKMGDTVFHPHLITSMIIHEFGHYLMESESVFHSETSAWDAGEEFFRKIDPTLIPEKFYDMRRYCLESYGEYNDDK